ncbi:hypothetical protein [Paraferrimonas sp. SM1919]|uniref:hypothetical protein n=1 Tax=Paraferrimonas sp. SM1919 TaxID=2662263 RepID=UPI0013D85B92|nr:hypothetical protein [Paraferrimonas sp. SM1919]
MARLNQIETFKRKLALRILLDGNALKVAYNRPWDDIEKAYKLVNIDTIEGAGDVQTNIEAVNLFLRRSTTKPLLNQKSFVFLTASLVIGQSRALNWMI